MIIARCLDCTWKARSYKDQGAATVFSRGITHEQSHKKSDGSLHEVSYWSKGKRID